MEKARPLVADGPSSPSLRHGRSLSGRRDCPRPGKDQKFFFTLTVHSRGRPTVPVTTPKVPTFSATPL